MLLSQTDYEEIFSQDHSIYETWRLCNAGHPDLPAMEYFENQYTFKQCDELIDVYAKAFLEMLPDKNRSVTFCVPTLPSTIIAFYALNKIGVRANFVSHTVLPTNPKEYLEDTDTEILILFDGFFKAVASSIKKVKLKKVIIISLSDDVETIPDYVPDQLRKYLQMTGAAKKIKLALLSKKVLSLEKFVNIGKKSKKNVESVYNKGDTAVVLYTGGSTGIPKGVEKTNEEFTYMARIYAQMDNHDIRPGDRNLLLIPPNHPTNFVHGITIPWLFGPTQVLQPIYNKDTFANDLYISKAQNTLAAPSHYATLMNCKLPDGALSNLKWAFCGGEAVSPELAVATNKELKRLGVINPYLVIGYGMSEIGPMAIFEQNNPTLGHKVGKPIPEVIARIVDDNGNILGSNKRGNLEIKTPCNMKGYFKNPKLTKEFFTDDGYAITGDIAICDEDGFYDVLGRATDSIIIPDGMKIYLFDIERVVYKDPAVLECEVVAIEAESIKYPVVHIVLNPEYIGQDAQIIKRIHQLCKEHLKDFEMPRGYKIRDNFGTNPISQKRDYQALLLERDGYFAVDGDDLVEIDFK